MDTVILAPLAGFLNVLIKQIIDAVMRGNNAHACAPHGERHCRLEKFIQRLVERGFINHHIPLKTAQV
ncbi:Uncharacterised protein [Escherichia coli]|nr:Uncharacterised protein [Escherichia coli]